MIVWLGVIGVPESLIPLEFESMEEARKFSQDIEERYMESENKLFMAIEIDEIYDELDIVYQDNNVERLEGAEISLDGISSRMHKFAEAIKK